MNISFSECPDVLQMNSVKHTTTPPQTDFRVEIPVTTSVTSVTIPTPAGVKELFILKDGTVVIRKVG